MSYIAPNNNMWDSFTSSLSSAYEKAKGAKNCANCGAYVPGTKYCKIWDAKVRPEYYCKKWVVINES